MKLLHNELQKRPLNISIPLLFNCHSDLLVPFSPQFIYVQCPVYFLHSSHVRHVDGAHYLGFEILLLVSRLLLLSNIQRPSLEIFHEKLIIFTSVIALLFFVLGGRPHPQSTLSLVSWRKSFLFHIFFHLFLRLEQANLQLELGHFLLFFALEVLGFMRQFFEICAQEV